VFSKSSVDFVPSLEGIASLMEAGVVSPQVADRMRSIATLRRKLPDHYVMAGSYDGVPPVVWLEVKAKWDGQPLEGDPSAEITQAAAPLQVRYQGFSARYFHWVVEAPTPEEPEAKESGRGRRKAGDE
jgi:hypothetical protein